MAQESPAGPGHNSAAAEEAERVQLLSIVAQVQKADEAVEAAKAPFDAAKKARTTIFRLAKAAGFSRGEIEKRMEEMQQPTTDMALQAIREAKHRKWLGILTPEQTAMFTEEGTPQETKDEFFWRGEGYKAGLRALIRKPPQECPERFVQPWLEDYDRGTETATNAIAAVAPKLTGGPKPPLSEVNAKKAQEVADKAKSDFEADEAELKAQKPRAAVVEAKAAEEPDPEAQIEDSAKKLSEAWGVQPKARRQTQNLAK